MIRSLGTLFEIDTKGSVLFIEDIDETGYKIYDYLTQLLLAGKFSSVRAVIFGNFKKCKQARAYIERFAMRNLTIPYLFFPCFGHGRPSYPIRIGAQCIINFSSGLLEFPLILDNKI